MVRDRERVRDTRMNKNGGERETKKKPEKEEFQTLCQRVCLKEWREREGWTMRMWERGTRETDEVLDKDIITQ